MRSGSRSRWVGGALIGILLSTACATAQPGASPGGSVASDGGTLKLRDSQGNYDTLNPVLAVNAGTRVIAATYDKLIAQDESGKVLPYLAKSWKVTPTSVTFNVRNDVKCHDGTTLTATAMASSLKYLFDPTTNSSQRPRYFGAGPWFVSGDDSDSTVTVTFGTPFSDALEGFATSTAAIICPAGLKDVKALDTKEFGSGPYVMDEVRQNDGATLSIYKDWNWGPFGITNSTPGRPSKVTIQIVANDTTAANLLLTGGLDAVNVGGAEITRLQADNSVQKISGAANVSWTLQLNHRPGRPTADQTLRHAIATVVNQKDFMQAAWNANGVQTFSLLKPGSTCADPEAASLVPATSVEKARALLLAAGYKPGSGNKLLRPDGQPLALTLLGANGSNHGNGPDYVQVQLNALGADTKLNKVDSGSWLNDLRAGNFDVAVVHTGGNTPSLMVANFFGSPPPAGSNYSDVQDPEINRLVPQAFAATGAERCPLWIAIQKAYLKSAHQVPLGIPLSFVFSRDLKWVPQFGGPGNLGVGIDYLSVVRTK